MCVRVCVRACVYLTMHFVALHEIFVILQPTGRISDVFSDVVVQIPAEILIRHHEQQSIQIFGTVDMRVQSSYTHQERAFRYSDAKSLLVTLILMVLLKRLQYLSCIQ